MDIVRLIDYVDTEEHVEIRNLSELIDLNQLDLNENGHYGILALKNSDNITIEKEIEELDLYFTQFIELSKKEEEYKRILEGYQKEKEITLDEFKIITKIKEIGLGKIISSGLVLAATTLTVLNVPAGLFIGTKIALGTSGVGVLGYMYLKK
jgi:hypothetical protein